MNQFESVEGVYEHIEEVTAKKLKEKLINSDLLNMFIDPFY
jgi:DNA polymerase-1